MCWTWSSPSSAARGTDQIGRDVLSRLIVGTRLSLLVGLAATVINATVALLIGTASGFLGGKTDLVIQRFVDAWMAFPGLLLLTIMSIVGRGPWQIIILGVAGGIGSSRIIRGAVLAIKENPYFEATQAIGSPHTRTLQRHLVPNLLPPVIIIFSVSVGGNILAAASLGLLGFGIDSATLRHPWIVAEAAVSPVCGQRIPACALQTWGFALLIIAMTCGFASIGTSSMSGWLRANTRNTSSANP